MNKIPCLTILGAALLWGCTSTRPFQPTNNARQSLDKGPSFARYEVRTGAGDFGMVRVNLRTTSVSETKVTLQMDVVNDSSKSVALDGRRLALQLFVDGKKHFAEILPSVVPTAVTIAGHSKKDFTLEFPVGSALKPRQITAFELAWGLVLGNENYTQTTGFSRDAGRDNYYTAYDPYFYPYAAYGYTSGPHRSRSSVNFGIGLGF